MAKMTQEQIEASKKLATESYQAKKKLEQEYRNELKEGMKYFHDNHLPMYEFYFSDEFFSTKNSHIIQMTWEIVGEMIYFAYCFLNPKDCSISSTRLAKSILGNRIMNKVEYVIPFSLNTNFKSLSEEEIALLGRTTLTYNALFGTYCVPNCIRRELKKFAKSDDSASSCAKVCSRE